jgi:hypothetical protein
MAEFIWKDGDQLMSCKTDSHSEDVEVMRKLAAEGKQFTYKKFGKKMHYSC